MFPNITRWAQKLIRLTEDTHSIFFDPRFLSCSALKKYIYFGQVAYERCATNLHTISMSQAKLVQIKLNSSFIGTDKTLGTLIEHKGQPTLNL